MKPLPRRQAECWFAVVDAYQACNRQYAAMLREFELTVPQFDVLDAIDRLGGDAQPKHIAERLLVTRGNISGLLTRLKERRLITTHPVEDDARAFVCALTRRGKALLRRARSGAAAFISAQLDPFSAAEIDATTRTMQRMRRHLESLDPVAIAGVAR